MKWKENSLEKTMSPASQPLLPVMLARCGQNKLFGSSPKRRRILGLIIVGCVLLSGVLVNSSPDSLIKSTFTFGTWRLATLHMIMLPLSWPELTVLERLGYPCLIGRHLWNFQFPRISCKSCRRPDTIYPFRVGCNYIYYISDHCCFRSVVPRSASTMLSCWPFRY